MIDKIKRIWKFIKWGFHNQYLGFYLILLVLTIFQLAMLMQIEQLFK